MTTNNGLSDMGNLFRSMFQENVYNLGVKESPTSEAEKVFFGLDLDFDYVTITCRRTGKIKFRKED